MDRYLPLDPYTLGPVDEPWRNRAAGVKGHAVRHENFTQVSEEVLAVLTHLGVAFDADNLHQLADALFDLWTASTAAKGPVLLATEAQVRDAIGDGAVQAKWLSYYARKLTANLLLYVRADGSDANSGLANTAGGAFATTQRAADEAKKLIGAGFKVTVNVGAGSFAPFALDNVPGMLLEVIGAGAATIVSGASGQNLVVASGGSTLILRSVKLAGGQNQIRAVDRSRIDFADVTFGKCAQYLAIAAQGSSLNQIGACSIVGDGTQTAQAALVATIASSVNVAGQTAALSGNPQFSTGFAWANAASGIIAKNFAFTGSATGPRYYADLNGVIGTEGGGANLFPGSAPGTIATGGQYA